MKKYYLILLFSFSMIASVVAQTTLTGKVTDENTGEEMIGEYITVTKKGNFIQKQLTDFDGNFSINVDPGEYELEVTYAGHLALEFIEVVAYEGMTRKLDIKINGNIFHSCTITTICSRLPLIQSVSYTHLTLPTTPYV